MIVNLSAEKNNALSQKARVNVVGSFSKLGFFDYGWN
jgi:hypothetical protein